MLINQKDKDILRKVAAEYAEIASLSIHRQTIHHWKQLNSLNPVKPMFMIDQIPWHEMNINDELTLYCENDFCKSLEQTMKQIIYKWNHMRCDMVVLPYVEIPKVITRTGIGISFKAKVISTDINNEIISHEYHDQIEGQEQLDKIHSPTVSYNESLTIEHEQIANQIFGDIIPIKMTGLTPEFRPWDWISAYRGVTPLLMDFADNPEFMHATIEKFTQIELDIAKQCENLNILEKDIHTIHCTGAFTDDLPSHGFDGVHVKLQDCWAFGMAQVFSSCSTDMHDEFEIEYAKRYYSQCGLVYYGCCEALHNRIHIIRKLPNVRKISISPWADVDIAAANIAGDFVLSRKPNPSYLANQSIDFDIIEKEILHTVDACQRNSTPVEFILKDLSTINYKPERLFKWYEMVKSIIEK